MVIQKGSKNSVDNVCNALLTKKVVLIPTDTVYGFSGIVPDTDKSIRQIKGREETKPFIQLIPDISCLSNITNDIIPDSVLKYWPGPLTIIVNDKVNGGTVALRCPNDEWLLSVLKEINMPIYSTSANRSHKEASGIIQELINEFENEVSIIVDDGDKLETRPSTIIKIEGNSYTIIRQGCLVL